MDPRTRLVMPSEILRGYEGISTKGHTNRPISKQVGGPGESGVMKTEEEQDFNKCLVNHVKEG